jgi:hypothetical protein
MLCDNGSYRALEQKKHTTRKKQNGVHAGFTLPHLVAQMRSKSDHGQGTVDWVCYNDTLFFYFFFYFFFNTVFYIVALHFTFIVYNY